MKEETWRDCIVTFIDVTGTNKAIKSGGSKGTDLMRALHRLAQKSVLHDHDCAYCWNDSVLLLAFWNKERTSGIRILREISELKQRIDTQIRKSYAICVKGQALSGGSKQRVTGKCTVLKTWSYAMANCFSIEAKAKNNESLRANWYVDSWIKKPLANLCPKTFPMKMLPDNNVRKILRLSDDDVKKLVSEVA